jgi:hypothetical protein
LGDSCKVHLYEDIRALAKETYPDYVENKKEEILKGPEKLYFIIDDIVPKEILYVIRSRFVFRSNKVPRGTKKKRSRSISNKNSEFIG